MLGPVGTAVIEDYIEVRDHLNQEPKQYVVYSHLHKQPLSTHSLYTKETIERSGTRQGRGQAPQYSKSKNQSKVEDIFAKYAKKLVKSGKCQSA